MADGIIGDYIIGDETTSSDAVTGDDVLNNDISNTIPISDFVFLRVFDIAKDDVLLKLEPIHHLIYKTNDLIEVGDTINWTVSFVANIENIEYIEQNVLHNITNALMYGLKHFANLSFSMPEDNGDVANYYRMFLSELEMLKTQYTTNNLFPNEPKEDYFADLI